MSSSTSKNSSEEKDIFADKAAAKLEEEERKVKKTKDYMPEVKEAIPLILSTLVPNDPKSFEEVLVKLLEWERKTRLAADSDSTVLLAQTILNLCHEQKNWQVLNEHISLISKRRAQLVKVIKHIVVHAMKFLDTTPNDEVKRDLINTLRAVCEGKIFLEVERADLTMTLAKMMERDGDISGAADLLQEIAVETIGGLTLKEKVEYLLEQFRLCLDKKDILRAELVAKKIRPKQLLPPGWKPIRVKYHLLMVRLHDYNNDFLQTANAWKAIYDALAPAEQTGTINNNTTTTETKSSSAMTDKPSNKDSKKDPKQIKAEEEAAAGALFDASATYPVTWQEALQHAIVYAILAPFDYEAKELLNRLAANRHHLAEVPHFASVLEQFLSDELMPWPLQKRTPTTWGILFKPEGSKSATDDTESVWRSDSAFAAEPEAMSAGLSSSSSSSSSSSPKFVSSAIGLISGNQGDRWEILHKRIVQRNIRIVAANYHRIKVARLGSLLGLDAAKTESHVCELVMQKQLKAKIDRPAGIVTFKLEQSHNDTLNQWSDDVARLLEAVETVSHLIQKENMVHNLTK